MTSPADNAKTGVADNSTTDVLRAKDGDLFISDWLRNRNTVEYLGIWESIHNLDFNSGEFARIKIQAEQIGDVYLHAATGQFAGHPQAELFQQRAEALATAHGIE